jgi:hypothetical protein
LQVVRDRQGRSNTLQARLAHAWSRERRTQTVAMLRRPAGGGISSRAGLVPGDLPRWQAPAGRAAGLLCTLRPGSSRRGDATTRVLRCTQGWTARWRAVSALGTWFALRSDEVGADRPTNRVWLGEGGTQEGVVTARLTAPRPTSGLSGC